MFIFSCRALWLSRKEDVITYTCYVVKDSKQKANELLFPLCPLIAWLRGGYFEGKCRSHIGKVGLLKRIEETGEDVSSLEELTAPLGCPTVSDSFEEDIRTPLQHTEFI